MMCLKKLCLLLLLAVIATPTTSAIDFNIFSNLRLNFDVGFPFIQIGQYGLQNNCLFDDDPDSYNICLDMIDTSGVYQKWMNGAILAAERWENVITADRGDPLDTSTPLFTSGIFAVAASAFPPMLDDIYVALRTNFTADEPLFTPVDGFQILAFAEVDLRNRDTSFFTRACTVVFNKEQTDILEDENVFNRLALHEMGHCLGIGLNFASNDLVFPNDAELDGPDFLNGARSICLMKIFQESPEAGAECLDQLVLPPSTYDAPGAQQAWEDIGCSGLVPLQNSPKVSEYALHWDEACLNNELMTPAFDPFFGGNKLSPITIAALGDLGYEVNILAADPYTVFDLGTCGDACPEADGGFFSDLGTLSLSLFRTFFSGLSNLFGGGNRRVLQRAMTETEKLALEIDFSFSKYSILIERFEKKYGSLEEMPDSYRFTMLYLDENGRVDDFAADKKLLMEFAKMKKMAAKEP